MTVSETIIPGVVVIEPRVFEDRRGYFFESYSKREFDRLVTPVDFVQDNESFSSYGVIRGLHFQREPFCQAKLIRVTEGAVMDVALDIRPDSPTFGRYLMLELSATNKRQLFLPRGIAHGFAVITPRAKFQYKCDNYYSPSHEGGINLLDASLGIEWPIEPDKMIISEKDLLFPTLSGVEF